MPVARQTAAVDAPKNCLAAPENCKFLTAAKAHYTRTAECEIKQLLDSAYDLASEGCTTGLRKLVARTAWKASIDEEEVALEPRDELNQHLISILLHPREIHQTAHHTAYDGRDNVAYL